MYNPLHEEALKYLNNLDSGIRLIVINPNYNTQRLLFNLLIKELNALYIRFEGGNLTLSQLRDQFDSALETEGGRADLNGVGNIVLDECDRADTEAFDTFIIDIAEHSGKARLFIFSRVLPNFALTNDDWRQKTCFIPYDESMMFWDYAQRDRQKTTLLEVRALGMGRVLLNGVSIDEWDGVLPRSLFFYLVDKGMTTRNEIFETFWPNLSVREATNVFHVTKRKISEVLGVDLTSYWSGFYHISDKIQLSYDVVQFSEMIQDSGIASLDEATGLLGRALGLYRGHFLTTMDNMNWVLKRRQELHQSYSETLVGLAKILEKQGNRQEALGLYLSASTTNLHREDIVLSIMQIYHDLGMFEDALKVYERLKVELAEALGVAPDKPLQELAENIRQPTKKRI
jgi:DNA-binding SARP family transcriptional activator